MGLKSTNGGEIVQVQGGHIIRATGRKDRHSKVFTAKGPRDRRVRLSAPTAIQFYDVQDRLGYDRPSKAVDWLINKAKASIDKLAQLPPRDPLARASHTVDFHLGDQSGGSSFYVPQCLDSEYSLGDQSMKSFFPTNNNNNSAENSISFQTYSHGSTQNNQDLCLSLHTHQDHTHSGHGSGLFQGFGSSFGLDDGPCWAEAQHQHELTRFTRMFGWPPPLTQQGLLFGEEGPMTTPYSERGTLQSSLSPLVRVLEDHQHHNRENSGVGLGHGSDEFMGFCSPTQFHELHGGANSMSNRASSSSLSPESSQH